MSISTTPIFLALLLAAQAGGGTGGERTAQAGASAANADTEKAATAPTDQTLTAEDVFHLEWADDPMLSPDGTHVLYLRRSNDIMSDRTRGTVWRVDLETGAHTPVLSGTGSFSSPRWSPDGGRIAYLGKTADERTGLFVRATGGGPEALLARFDEAPRDLTWAPDGERLAFTLDVAEEGDTLLASPATTAPEGAEWAEAPKMIDRARYRSDGGGFLESAARQIFVIPADGGTPRQLTRGYFDHEGPLSFTPDGGALYFSANRHEGWELETVEADIFRLDVTDGTLTQITDEPGAETAPTLSPDGERIAYLKRENVPEPYIPAKIIVMDLDGTDARSLAEDFDRQPGDLQWADDGAALYFSYDDRGQKMVGRVPAEGGPVETAAAGLSGTTIGRPYTSGAYDAGPEGRVVFTAGTAQRPADLFVTDGDGAPRQLTRLNEDLLGHKTLGEVHEVTYASSLDGEEIQGWYVTPPDYEEGKTYPLIVEIHGGPHLAYGPNFAAELQRMAAAGYVVFYANHRGSASYGERFAQLLKYKYSSKDDFTDHMSGVDHMISLGMIDEDNLFIAGGSAGGIATAYAVGLTDRFNAAVAAKPVINWVSKTLTADSYIYQIRHQFPDYPWNALDHYWERSPLSLVGQVTTPTLLITGEEDYRTPISETEQFYQALQLRGVPTAMVRIPGSSHGIASRPSRLNAKVDYTLAWFDRYKADGDRSADSDAVDGGRPQTNEGPTEE